MYEYDVYVLLCGCVSFNNKLLYSAHMLTNTNQLEFLSSQSRHYNVIVVVFVVVPLQILYANAGISSVSSTDTESASISSSSSGCSSYKQQKFCNKINLEQ